MSRLGCLTALVVFWLIVGELLARQAIDLKLYGSDSEVGYWVLPDQKGGSLLVGSYAINGDGLGVEEPFRPTAGLDVLLVGDSIVLGTSRVDQAKRLGPQLEALSGWDVWPLSAGSWSLWNEIRMIERKPVLLQSDIIVFIVNAKDFDRPSFWDNEFNHPRRKPASYLAYALQKKFRGLRGDQHPGTVRQSDLKADWKEFRERSRQPILVVGYDGRRTTGRGCSWLPSWLGVETACFDPIRRGEKDNLVDQIHLNAGGNASLARFIAEQVKALNTEQS